MKGIYLTAVFIVFLASWSTIIAEENEFDKIPTKCPTKDPKDTTIHLAHEYDCTKFYMCQGGKKILRECPYMNKHGDRLHFNPRLQVCDWPYHAGCKNKNSNQDEDKVLNAQFVLEEEHHGLFLMDKIPTKCPAKDPKNATIYLAHESDCTKFYMCQAGKKIVKQCPKYNKKGDRLHFNPRLQVCDWPWLAGCKHKNSDEDQAVATSEKFIAKKTHNREARMINADNKCPDKNPGNTTILLPHEYDCTKFYMCLGREKIERYCPQMNKNGDRLHFNPRLKICDWPDKAGCNDKDFDEDQVEIITKQPILDEEDESWGEGSWEDGSWEIPTKCPAVDPKNTTIHLAHESDCTKFYMCQQGKKILRECPYMNEKGDRLHFNPRLQVCDWPWSAGCRESTHPTRHTDHTRSTEPTWPTRHTKSTHSTRHTSHTDHTRSTEPTWPTRHTKSTYSTWRTSHTDHTRSTEPTWPTRHTKSTHSTRHTSHTDHTRSTEPTWPTRHTKSTHSTWRTSHTDHTRSTEPTWPTRPPPDDKCTWDNDGLLLPHQCNCDMFFECVKGDKVLRECPNGLYFSKKHQGCVKIGDSDCKPKPTVKCTKKGELIPHECDCTKYYKCREDDQVLRSCENGLHFSPKRRKCEDPDKAGCDRDESHSGPGDCPKPVPEHPWRHECDCRLFYKCENGKKRLYECPWGYYFDVKKDGCVPQEHITDCKNH